MKKFSKCYACELDFCKRKECPMTDQESVENAMKRQIKECQETFNLLPKFTCDFCDKEVKVENDLKFKEGWNTSFYCGYACFVCAEER